MTWVQFFFLFSSFSFYTYKRNSFVCLCFMQRPRQKHRHRLTSDGFSNLYFEIKCEKRGKMLNNFLHFCFVFFFRSFIKSKTLWTFLINNKIFCCYAYLNAGKNDFFFKILLLRYFFE